MYLGLRVISSSEIQGGDDTGINSSFGDVERTTLTNFVSKLGLDVLSDAELNSLGIERGMSETIYKLPTKFLAQE